MCWKTRNPFASDAGRGAQRDRRGACPTRNRNGAFTVTELMVAVSLMSLIVLALYSMFSQVQRALRSNEAQVDSSERGRAILELVGRDLESARVSMRPFVTNLYVRLAPQTRNFQDDSQVAGGLPPSGTAPRTNVFDYIYFMSKADKAWRGLGFTVMVRTNFGVGPDGLPGAEILAPAIGSLGTLYRYETKPVDREYQAPTTNLFRRFAQMLPNPAGSFTSWPRSTNFSQVADGVVHFRALTYDTEGRVFASGGTNLDSHYRIARVAISGGLVFPYPLSNVPANFGLASSMANVIVQQALLNEPTLESTVAFRSNALPAYIELELGVLEPETMRQYDQMVKDGQPVLAKRYLERRMAKVQVFRKRIPLKSVAQ